MPDLLSTGSDWLQSQRHQHLSRPVVYCRGPLSLDIQATVAPPRAEEYDANGTLISRVHTDFLVRVEDLAFGEPEKADQIIDAGVTFDVLPIPGEPCFRYSDQNRRTYRIHTKERGT